MEKKQRKKAFVAKLPQKSICRVLTSFSAQRALMLVQ